MLEELTIRDFAIIDDLYLHLEGGFGVLTGETGAGKSIILDAVTLVLGGRADSSMVRAGEEMAYIEATFALNGMPAAEITPLLVSEGLEAEDGGHLVLAREVRSNGRSIARVNGRTVTLTLLRQLAEPLVDIHGQGEHLSLLRPQAHLPLLDAYAGLELQRNAYAGVFDRLRAVEKELLELRRDERMIAQRIDMLTFQVEEISAAALQAGEEEDLREERTRLANAEQLQQLTARVIAGLIGNEDDDEASAIDLMGQSERALLRLAELDDGQRSLLLELQGLSFQLSEVAAQIQQYQTGLEHNPDRLNDVEERLELIGTLKRKYGESIADVLLTEQQAAAELERITHSEERIAELERDREKYLREIGELGELLSEARKTAAQRLSSAVERELHELYMDGARFAVSFDRLRDESGAYVGEERVAFDRTGIDRAEFIISANPGEPLKPMARVASGGETARLMLALKSALAAADATPTLIFDEIDQGIGGRVGDVVGRKLWALSAVGGHQVIIVTHLPQLAGYADKHLHVSKRVKNGRTTTQIRALDRAGRIDELAAMLGTSSESAVNGARSILNHVEAVKLSRTADRAVT